MATRKILTQADREERQAERNAKLQRARSLLEEGLAKLQTSDDWRAMLERTAKSLRPALGAGRFSFRNQLLLWMQLGAADIGPIATFETWKRVGRHVKKGEKALFILQPRPIRPHDKATGKTVSFDDDATGDVIMTIRPLALFPLRSTDGVPLEEAPKLTGDITAPEPFERAIETLRDVVLALDGKPVSSVDIRPREVGDHPTAFGWYMRTTKAIVVINTGNRAQMLRTLVHETAHAVLHGPGDHHHSPTKEIEAESVSYIVSHAIGLDTPPTRSRTWRVGRMGTTPRSASGNRASASTWPRETSSTRYSGQSKTSKPSPPRAPSARERTAIVSFASLLALPLRSVLRPRSGGATIR